MSILDGVVNAPPAPRVATDDGYAGCAPARLRALRARYRGLLATSAEHPPAWYSRRELRRLEAALVRRAAAGVPVVVVAADDLRELLAGVRR